MPVSGAEPAEGLAPRVRQLDDVTFQYGGSEAEDIGGSSVHGDTFLGVIFRWSSQRELHDGAGGDRAVENSPGVGNLSSGRSTIVAFAYGARASRPVVVGGA